MMLFSPISFPNLKKKIILPTSAASNVNILSGPENHLPLLCWSFDWHDLMCSEFMSVMV